MLAKYGFIEEAPGGQGREKPWQVTSRDQSFTAEGLGEEGQLAAEAAGDAFLDNEYGLIKERMRRRGLEPPEWRKESTGLSASSVYLTADEAKELRHHMMEIVDKHDDRWDNPDLRPEGARQVRVFLSVSVVPERPQK
jgi:hypothetical protein